MSAGAYFQQQTNLAAATIAEGAAEAASIKKMREGMMNEGGLIQVQKVIAEILKQLGVSEPKWQLTRTAGRLVGG